jgi:hypothetical protein
MNAGAVARAWGRLGMADRHRKRAWRTAAVALATALLIPSAGPVSAAPVNAAGPAIGECAAQAEGAIDLLPDVSIAPMYGLTIRTSWSGRKHLRFGTKSWNSGDGPIEVRGDQPSGDRMGRVAQRIFDDQGGCRDVIQPLAKVFYAGDGHNHWHVNKYMVTKLYRQAGGNVVRIRKTGFCLLDLHHANNPPPNSPTDRVYWNGACGGVGAESLAMGISVGYADDYAPLIAQQWIDVTGLPNDVYRLCTGVNPFGWWLERDGVTTNNFLWYDVRLDLANNRVTVLAQGRTNCMP